MQDHEDEGWAPGTGAGDHHIRHLHLQEGSIVNTTPFLQYAGYVGVAALAVLGNHFFGLPDTQTTVLLIGGALTALGYSRVSASTTAQSAPLPPLVSSSRAAGPAMPYTQDLQPK